MKSLRLNCQKFVRSVRDRGLRKTVTLIYYEKIWLRRFAADTGGVVRLETLRIEGPNVVHGVRYEGVNYAVFRALFEALPLAAQECVFLDLGCGKGQALLFALHHGVSRLSGVEFAEELAQTCRHNLARATTAKPVTWNVVTADAAEYPIPDEVNVVFLFNPFNAHVLAAVLQNLNESLQRAPRRLYVLYANAQLLRFFLQAGYRVVHSFHHNAADMYVEAGSAVLVREP